LVALREEFQRRHSVLLKGLLDEALLARVRDELEASPRDISAEATGPATSASNVPVSCSSRSRRASPTLAAWMTTVSDTDSRAGEVIGGATEVRGLDAFEGARYVEVDDEVRDPGEDVEHEREPV
jgi:hypothetical protein